MRADVDLRSLIGADVLDQGTRPTCVAFASSASHEALQGGMSPEHFAPEAIWWQAARSGYASAAGMVLDHADAGLSGYGQPELIAWPYNCLLGAGTEEPPKGLEPPWRRARLRPVPLRHDGVEDPIEDELALNRPIVLVIEVTDAFHLPDDTGIVQVPDLRANPGGYHAVTCVGAANHPARGRLLLIKNSWGTAWGRGGYCWLPVDYLTAFAVQAATIIEIEEEPDD